MKEINYIKPLYSVWSGMKKRCYTKTNKAYKWYGGRGITICDEWLNSFPMFEKWAISHGYRSGLTIERENVNKGYEPRNCKFIPNEGQNRNRRSNVSVTAFGEIKTLLERSEDTRCKVPYQTPHYRIRRRKADPEWSIITPLQHRNSMKTECKYGHQFTPDNTYYSPTDGSRHCRICVTGYYRSRNS